MFWPSTPLEPPFLWCRMMNYELIDQLYMTGNTILYIKSVHLSEYWDARMTRETLILNMNETRVNFFLVNCNVYFVLRPGIRVLGIVNQWSGRWGLKMLFERNFKRIDREYYDVLFPEDYELDDSLPYPVIPVHMLEENRLAFAMGTEPQLRTREGNPQSWMTDSELKADELNLILKHLTLK
jgi:hypothetical protein